MINGVIEDRLCGFGPPLEFYLREDLELANTRSQVISYIEINYNAADKYIKRFVPINKFYAEDYAKQAESIENEKSEYE